MSSTCDLVIERIAVGEPLGDAADHAATCERCRQLVALPVEIGAMHREIDPGLGFSARMTAGAQQRIVVRRRRRVAAGVATAVAATTLGVFVLTREPERSDVATVPPTPTERELPASERDPWNHARDDGQAESDQRIDDDVRLLVRLANTERASKLSGDWQRINQPLAPYRALLRGVSHE